MNKLSLFSVSIVSAAESLAELYHGFANRKIVYVTNFSIIFIGHIFIYLYASLMTYHHRLNC